jgi:hypothetical protein
LIFLIHVFWGILQTRRKVLKKVTLITIASVIALAMILPLASVAAAQSELATEAAPAVRLALDIQAPESAKVGQPLKIRVITRPGGRPVYRAGVWAININDITNVTSDSEDYAVLAEKCGRFLGWTNMRGYVDPLPRIWDAGRYILVAVKPHFVPGLAKIKIERLTPLTLKAPDSARVGQIVTLKVTEPVNKPVPRTALFAIPLRNMVDKADQTGAYDQLVKDAQAYAEQLGDAEAELTEDTENSAEINNIRCYFIGFTDQHGEKTHRFSRIGPHLLIAAKCGYIPDFKIIQIRGLQPISVKPLPMKVDPAVSVKPLPMKVDLNR